MNNRKGCGSLVDETAGMNAMGDILNRGTYQKVKDVEGKMSDMNMHTLGAGFVDHGCERRTRLIEPDCIIVFDGHTYRWHL